MLANCVSSQVIYGLVMWYLRNLKKYGGVFGDLLCIIVVAVWLIIIIYYGTYSGSTYTVNYLSIVTARDQFCFLTS